MAEGEKERMTFKVYREPLLYPCILKEQSTWTETVKSCSDYEASPNGLRCVHWDFWAGGCRIKRVIGMKEKKKE